MEGSPKVLYVGGHDGAEPAARLSAAGFTVEGVVGEREALAAARTDHELEVCVTRYEVPRADGVEFGGGLAVVEALEAERPSLPVILFTRMANHDVAREVSGRDLFDYIPIQSDADPYDRLVRRTRTAARQYRTDRQVEQLSRINEIVRDVNRELVRADDRETVERAVCEELTQRGAYAFARFEGGTTITARDEETNDQIDSEAIAERLLTAGPGVVDLDDRWQPYTAGIVVPVALGETHYGRVVLCTTRAGAFDETEREVLTELGETIADALDAIETKEQLTARERELAEQNRRLEEFASIVSHDLRNPLQVADGYLQQLRTEYDDDRFDEIDRAATRIETIIEDVLALTQGGDSAVTKTTVDLARAVERAWATVDTADATLVSDVSGTIQADSDRLARLFENLFRNAVEHSTTSPDSQTRQDAVEHSTTSPDSQTRQDAVEHSTTSPPSHAPADAAEHGGTDLIVRVVETTEGFAVEDDGPGIPRDERETVMKMGHSGCGGTGLGLAIVARIADAHGWSVSVEESDAGGARFAFDIGRGRNA